MNTTTLYTIALKLTGLVALWQFVQALSGVFTGFGLLALFTSGGLHNSFMVLIGANMVLNIGVLGAFAFFALLKTEMLLSLFNMSEPETILLDGNRGTFFKALVLSIGVLVTIHGIGAFLSYNYNTETKTEQNFNQQTNGFENRTFITQTETKNINYLAIVEILAGVLLLSNITPIGNRLEIKYSDSDPVQRSAEDQK